jgi:hypothetical protein
LVAALCAAQPVSVLAAGPANALATIEPGEWRLHIKGEAPRSLCVADPAALLQLRHGPAVCSHLVVTNDAKQATWQYSCPKAGWGRTTVHVLTPRAVTIDSQGIADNAPFAFSADAHRIGACATKPVRHTR